MVRVAIRLIPHATVEVDLPELPRIGDTIDTGNSDEGGRGYLVTNVTWYLADQTVYVIAQPEAWHA